MSELLTPITAEANAPSQGRPSTKYWQHCVITVGLLLVLVVSSMAVVYASHSARQLYSEQGELQSQYDALQLEFAQLLLEQSAWSSPNRIEAMASEDLQMMMPDASHIEVVK